MGCGSANDAGGVEYVSPIVTTPQYNIITFKFKLSTGEEYTISGKENEKFKTVFNKFITEHSEINNKNINAFFKNSKIDFNKTLLENKITNNNLIILDIEESEEDDDEIYLEYNPENVIWLDENIDNSENKGYLNELNSLGYNVQCFKNVDEGFKYIQNLKFESTKIIISGRLYLRFIKKFIDNLNEIYVIPKIIIFTRNKTGFLKYTKSNENIVNHPFFNFGGIRISITEVISFLKDEFVQDRVKRDKPNKKQNLKNKEFLENRLKTKDNVKLTFDYIDSNQKLALPLLYNSLIDSTKIDDIEKYTEILYSKYSDSSSELKELLNQIKSVYDIPIELLSKYYARLYTIESDFYRDINNDLRNNKTMDYLPYIKVLYEGVKLKSLNITNDSELYRGSKISLDEIEKIKGYLDTKVTNLQGAIVFSKSFLSFSKVKSIAVGFLGSGPCGNNLGRVLYVLEGDINIDYSLSTNTDIERISIFGNEKEVLFFPFSPFEIKEVKEIQNEDETIYEVRLLYLGKYLKEIEKDVNIIEIENDIPDSEFKKQILEIGLIDKNKINNTKQIFNNFKQFQNKVENDGFQKFNVKNVPSNLYDSFNDDLNEEEENKNKKNLLAKSYNINSTFVKNKLNQSQMLKKTKTISYNEGFTIKIMEEGNYTIKVVNINLAYFLGEYLIPIWFEKDNYIKFITEANYRINDTSQFHNSTGLQSSMTFNYGATIARIGSGEHFVLPNKEYIYFSKDEGPLYLKIKYPNNMVIKPEGKIKIKIYDGELMTKEEIYAKIGWKEKDLKYADKSSTFVENDLTIYLNNLRMNPVLFYESYIKDDNPNKTYAKKLLNKMGENNDLNGIKPFSVNNDLYDLIKGYIQNNYDSIKKKLSKKNTIESLKELQELLNFYLKDIIGEDLIINCKRTKKSEVKHICLQYLYDKTIIENIFDPNYNSIAIHIKDDIFADFYLIILAITKVEKSDTINQE